VDGFIYVILNMLFCGCVGGTGARGVALSILPSICFLCRAEQGLFFILDMFFRGGVDGNAGAEDGFV
jgi:hypothetical protein